MNITYYGHSCFELTVNNKRLLFDPFITPNPAAANISLADLKPDYILVSHAHYDHVADLVAVAKSSNAQVICSYEIMSWLVNQGVSNCFAMNIGGNFQFDFGTVRMVAANHSSSFPDGSYGGIAAGFLLTSNEGNVYYSGDTALTHDMQLIPHYAPELALALLPIGNCFTMDVKDAAIAARWVNAKKVIGLHFDTFPPIKINHEEALNIFKEAGKHLVLLGIGEAYSL